MIILCVILFSFAAKNISTLAIIEIMIFTKLYMHILHKKLTLSTMPFNQLYSYIGR